MNDVQNPKPQPQSGGIKLDELFPALGFVATYLGVSNLFSGAGAWSAESAIYWATAVAVITSLALVIWKKLNEQAVSPVLWFMTILVTFMGIIVIGLQEDVAVYMKPTFANTLFAVLLFVSLAFGFNPIKYLAGDSLPLPDQAWFWMAIRWGIFFLGLALWNEYLWRSYCPLPEEPFTLFGLLLAPSEPYSFLGLTFGLKDAESVWAWWKLGNVGVTFVFVILNSIFLLPYLKEMSDDTSS